MKNMVAKNKSSLKRLMDAGKFLEKFAENSGHVYWVSSADFKRIQYISPAYEKIWGRSREELYREPEKWITFLHPDDILNHHPIEEMTKRVKEEGEKARFEESYRIIRPDGTLRWIIDRGFPVLDERGICYGVTGVAIDVTTEKQREAELFEAKEVAEVANEAKSEFLRNMEHQLRTPFCGIYSMVEILASSETDPQKKKMLEVTYQSAKEFLELLNKIIDFARFQMETTEVIAKKFDLKKLIEKTVTTERAAAMSKHLSLTYDYPDIPTIYINDPHRIQRIILNLLSNAIKFTHKGGINVCVELGKRVDDKHYIIKIIVSDTGIGIAKEKQRFIYERFYRAHPANQNKYTGAGLSLHIVKQLVSDLDGEIEAQSEPEKGTTFTVILPLKRPLLDELSDEEL
jgi:two-component system aerobic respiration control sensor histidine kinase ArcB